MSTYNIIFYVLISIAMFFSVYLIVLHFNNNRVSVGIRFKRNRFRDLRDTLKEQISDESVDNALLSAGTNIKSYTYQVIRYSVLFVWACIIIYQRLNEGVVPRISLAFLIVLFLLSSPKDKVFGFSSPFYFIIESLKGRYRFKLNKEIYRSLSQLKNLSIVSGANIGSDYVLEELMKYSKNTKPIFSKFLSLWYEADKISACDYFASAIGTKEGRELSNLFLKLDDLSPSELKHHIELYQSMIKDEMRTLKEKSNETRGNIVYAMVMFSAFIVLVNFLIVVITVDALNYYHSLFN